VGAVRRNLYMRADATKGLYDAIHAMRTNNGMIAETQCTELPCSLHDGYVLAVPLSAGA
jgi:hypothetical protein